ncbi:MAG: LuxR C-terminal-related transcriptional regulator [Actinomycetota bacterium]|nr:LuxR C-terminal-related transcriptional regulator [Actinomycetota bacterium]MDA8281524.1 LuxR C-terminal-related transcriptional regulator [Actinomycetota bacterium]
MAIVENHEIVARSLVAVLTTWGIRATALCCGQLDQSTLVDVVDYGPWWTGPTRIALVDLNLRRDLDGVELIRPLCDRGIVVGVVSGVGDRIRLARAVEAGAQAVVSKAQPLSELLEALTDLAGGSGAVTKERRAELLAELAAERRQIQPLLAKLASLTRAEADVLVRLCGGWHVAEVAAVQVVSVATVRSHVHAILVKLDVHTQRDAIWMARAAGWVSHDRQQPMPYATRLRG